VNAETLMLAGGVTSFLMTVHWVRKRDLREKYAVVWLAVATLLLLCGLFPQLIMTWAESAHLSYPSAVLFLALAFIYPFAFSVSLSLTRQYRRNVRLMQTLALLEQRVRVLEQAGRGREAETTPAEDKDLAGRATPAVG
jgi:uncharacterized membrane protein YfcA